MTKQARIEAAKAKAAQDQAEQLAVLTELVQQLTGMVETLDHKVICLIEQAQAEPKPARTARTK